MSYYSQGKPGQPRQPLNSGNTANRQDAKTAQKAYPNNPAGQLGGPHRPLIRSAQPVSSRRSVPPVTDQNNSPLGGNRYPRVTNRKANWITVTVIALVAVFTLIGVVLFNHDQQKQPPPSPQTRVGFTDPCKNIPYCAVIEDPDTGAEGIWVIDKYSWSGETLTLQMTLTATKGSLRFSFSAFDHTRETQQYKPQMSFSLNDISRGSINEGEKTTGTVKFSVARQKLTIIMHGASRVQNAMIEIPG